MKSILTFGWETAIFVAIVAACSGCTASDAPQTTDPAVQDYFYPLDNGVIYKYQRFYHNQNDTLALRMFIGQPYAMQQTMLVNNVTNTAYYYVRYSIDASGNLAGVLATDSSTLLALDGKLEPGATWVADENNGIHATVLDRPYDDFYLPGRQEDFMNVLAVKYHQDGQSEGNYTLRFFAKGRGLILEQEFVGPGTQIASLQLIGIQ